MFHYQFFLISISQFFHHYIRKAQYLFYILHIKGAAKCGAFHILHVAKRAYLSSYFLTITVAL